MHDRTKTAGWIFLLHVTFASVAFAQHAADKEPKTEQTQKSTAPSGTANRPNQPPIVVNVLPTPKTADEQEQEVRDRREKGEIDRKLADFTERLYYATVVVAGATMALVVATIVLGVFAGIQARDMKQSISEAKKSADAAKKAANVAELF